MPNDKIKFFKVKAVTVLSQVYELWITTQKQESKIQALEITIFRGVKEVVGFTIRVTRW